MHREEAYRAVGCIFRPMPTERGALPENQPHLSPFRLSVDTVCLLRPSQELNMESIASSLDEPYWTDPSRGELLARRWRRVESRSLSHTLKMLKYGHLLHSGPLRYEIQVSRKQDQHSPTNGRPSGSKGRPRRDSRILEYPCGVFQRTSGQIWIFR
jgi:hypothetical protein